MEKKTTTGLGFCLLVIASLLIGAPAALAVEPAGSGPDSASRPSNDWVSLQPGAGVWYAFEYAGDGSQIDVQLQAEPQGSVALAVWTPAGVRDWRLGLEADPIGRGSADPGSPGSIVWSGNFRISGTYYVVVERSGSASPGTSYYFLQVKGSGVSLSAPAAKPAKTPAPSATPGARPSAAASPPAGKLVVQTSMGGPFYVVNADGSGLRRVGNGMDPTWSPDGKQIAFIRWQEPRGVWIVDANGGNEWRVFDWDEVRWLSWSPDGARLLFSRQSGGRTEDAQRCFFGFCFAMPAHPHWKLGTVRPATGEFQEPPASQFSLAPQWSPLLPDGGTRFVYADEQGLRIQNEDGSVSYLITHDSRDTGPAWSPDGTRIAFTRRQHDHWEVYAADADGRNPVRLTDTPKKPNGEVGSSASAAWSPDGQYLAFLTDRSGKWEIWIMRADGSQEAPMFKTALAGLTLDYASLGERAISWTR